MKLLIMCTTWGILQDYLRATWELLWGLLENCLNTTQEIGTGHCMGFILGSLWGYLATSLGLLDEQILGDYLRSNKEYLDYLGAIW